MLYKTLKGTTGEKKVDYFLFSLSVLHHNYLLLG